MNAAIVVGEHYELDGVLVSVEASDEHEVVYRALNDQDAIDRGWWPTSYGAYEAMTTPASFARDATMASDAPEDDGTEAESLAEVETPRHPFTPPADADYSTTGVPVVDLVLGKDRTPRWSDAGYASIDFGGAA